MGETAVANRGSEIGAGGCSSPAARSRAANAGFDLDRCVDLAADSRAWYLRAGWHDRAACRGLGPSTFVGDEPPAEAALAFCARCPVREECLVDGLRQRADGLLAEAADEMFGYFGGLNPEERWGVLGDIRRRAETLGVALADLRHNLSLLVLCLHQRGWTHDRIADETGVEADAVVDALIWELHKAGQGHRTIARHVPGRSYKWVERRLRAIRATTSATDQTPGLAPK